jgi:hypothetical protein
MSLTGPHGTPASTRSAIHSSQVRWASAAVMAGTSTARFSTRLALVANRGSSSQSGCPTTSHSFAQSFWLAAAIAIGRSLAGKT